MQDYKDPEVLQKVYAECGSLVKTAAYFGVSKKLILTHLKRFGITRNPPKQKKPVDVEQARRLLDSGIPLGEVAQVSGIGQATLRQRLLEQGIVSNRYHKGFKKTWSGYIMLHRPSHPRADKQGYIREHILIMEAHIGRFLAENEVVHHINGQKDDNRIENLQLMDKWEHKSHHSRKPRKNKI